jgi:hypothetical protein
LKLSEDDERLACMGDDCNFHLKLWAEGKVDAAEELASLEHEQWMAWAESLMKTEHLTFSRVERWQGLMVPYNELSDEMKEHDRKWAKKVLEVITQ